MRVIFSPAARRELKKIGDYISHDNPARAVTFVQEILARCRKLADTPDAYPLMLLPKTRGVRKLVHGRYLIFYVVTSKSIRIAHVLNAAQDHEAILSRE